MKKLAIVVVCLALAGCGHERTPKVASPSPGTTQALPIARVAPDAWVQDPVDIEIMSGSRWADEYVRLKVYNGDENKPLQALIVSVVTYKNGKTLEARKMKVEFPLSVDPLTVGHAAIDMGSTLAYEKGERWAVLVLKAKFEEPPRTPSGGLDVETSSSEPTTSPPASNSPNIETVYTTDTGECYHAAGCSSLRLSSHETTREEAEARGLRRCQRCNP